ncbi:MAG: hypothetical protein KIT73_10065 [Burkholderiales bacterium]|nr:hypothetical protein [Burkholderiales bacterium]
MNGIDAIDILLRVIGLVFSSIHITGYLYYSDFYGIWVSVPGFILFTLSVLPWKNLARTRAVFIVPFLIIVLLFSYILTGLWFMEEPVSTIARLFFLSIFALIILIAVRIGIWWRQEAKMESTR